MLCSQIMNQTCHHEASVGGEMAALFVEERLLCSSVGLFLFAL